MLQLQINASLQYIISTLSTLLWSLVILSSSSLQYMKSPSNTMLNNLSTFILYRVTVRFCSWQTQQILLTWGWNNVKIDNSTCSPSFPTGVFSAGLVQDQTRMWQEVASIKRFCLSHNLIIFAFGTLRIMKHHWRNKVSTAALPTSLYSAINLSLLLHLHEHDDHY